MNRNAQLLAVAGLSASLGLYHAVPAAGQPTPEVTELIVLVAPMEEAPEPEDLVDAVNNGGPIPGGFDEGDPYAADLVITRRATGATREWMEANPDTPLARLERYVVLAYPEATDLDEVAAVLRKNPYVENVEENAWLTLSGSPPLPDDPLIDPSSGDPSLHQWGPHTMNLPEAWQHARGHAWVGLIDTGLEVEHPDLRTYSGEPGVDLVYHGGNFREHLSEDFRFDDCNVDELDPDDGFRPVHAGHGAHVAGIVAATTDNDMGVAGTCWHCSLLMARVFADDDPDASDPLFPQAQVDRIVRSLHALMDRGAQIVSKSFGLSEPACAEGGGGLDLGLFCQAIRLAAERDIVLVASSGNDKEAIEFPANDPRVLAIGGIEHDPTSETGYAFWDEAPDCPPFQGIDTECGSNFGPEQALVAPAKTVLSTVYTGRDHNPIVACGDNFLAEEGYGPCTGTSMSAPFVAGLAGILRSVNPRLDREEVRDALIGTASQADSHDVELGYGVPDAAAAVRRVLGIAGGEVLPNRLTPLLSLYSPGAMTHVYTVFPSAALAFLFDPDHPFHPVGPPAPGGAVPGFPQDCPISPCPPGPGASVYLFTSKEPPFPGAPELVPLHRLRYDPNLPNRCAEPPPPHIDNRDFSYTTTEEGILFFKEEITDADGLGYELDGIEGYIFPLCEPDPECIPEGAERLYRLYHPIRDDFAIFPHRELDAMLLEGYQFPGSLADWIGYAYPNEDTDGDGLIDGFERMIGTDLENADTDCDGVSDGDEVHVYDLSNPDPALRGYRDPLDGPCLFLDGFESGDTSRWSSAQG